MEDKQVGLYRRAVVNKGAFDERYGYEPVVTSEVLEYANPQAAGMIRGLVRAAELLEGRELDIGHVEIWDSTAQRALQDARDHGWCLSPKPIPKPRMATPEPPEAKSFQEDLQGLINRHCVENGSNTPDYLLASYLQSCLDNWNKHVLLRDKWYGIAPHPGGTAIAPSAP